MSVCAVGRDLTTLERGMSQLDAVRGGDEVVRELLQLDQQVKAAQKVLILDGEARPRLLAELNKNIEVLGLKCVPVEELSRACGGDCPSKAPCKRFSDIELAPLAESESTAQVVCIAPVTPVTSVVEVAQLAEALERAPVLAPQPVERLDMSKPINWMRGDIFTENPRFTLLHQRREWTLSVIDVVDADALTGLDVEIQRVGAGDNVQELMSIQQFMAGYVFVRRPQSPA